MTEEWAVVGPDLVCEAVGGARLGTAARCSPAAGPSAGGELCARQQASGWRAAGELVRGGAALPLRRKSRAGDPTGGDFGSLTHTIRTRSIGTNGGTKTYVITPISVLVCKHSHCVLWSGTMVCAKTKRRTFCGLQPPFSGQISARDDRPRVCLAQRHVRVRGGRGPNRAHAIPTHTHADAIRPPNRLPGA